MLHNDQVYNFPYLIQHEYGVVVQQGIPHHLPDQDALRDKLYLCVVP